MAVSILDNRIQSQIKRIAVIDDKISRLMGHRIDEEAKLADLYEMRNAIARVKEGHKDG